MCIGIMYLSTRPDAAKAQSLRDEPRARGVELHSEVVRLLAFMRVLLVSSPSHRSLEAEGG